MLNLIFAIVFSSGNSLIMKFAETRTRNKFSLLLVNYVVAVLFGSTLIARSISAAGEAGAPELGRVPVLALINGAFYVSTFLLLQLNIKKNGATISASLSHMGLVIPVLLSVVVFGESPNVCQGIGVACAIVSLSVISWPGKITSRSHADSRFRWLLIPMLISGGMADMMSKVFETACDHALEDFFLSGTFVSALVICAIAFLVSRERINRWDIFYGIALGVSNYLSTKFLVRAIYDVPAFMAYITYGLGVVVFINVVNVVVLHEKLGRRDYIGMVLSAAAILLLNL